MVNSKEKEKMKSNDELNKELYKLEKKNSKHSTDPKVIEEKSGYMLRKGIREGFQKSKKFDPNK